MDAEGKPAADAVAALSGAMLPFGGHKGAAIGTMIELLAGVTIGGPTSPGTPEALGNDALEPVHGELVVAFSPEAFEAGRPGDPFARAEMLVAAISAQDARLPSERRFAVRDRALTEGIPLTPAEVGQLDRFLAPGLKAVV